MVCMVPTDITLRRESKMLVLQYADGKNFCLPFEYLRVFSPSAEVRGHGAKSFDNMDWPLHKTEVNLSKIVPVGNYALQLWFDDGHNSGLYTWEWLRTLGDNHAEYWAEYCQRTDSSNDV